MTRHNTATVSVSTEDEQRTSYCALNGQLATPLLNFYVHSGMRNEAVWCMSVHLCPV